MDQVIVFLSPESIKDRLGIQRVDDETHTVVEVLLDTGEDVSSMGVSYKALDD